MITIASVTKSDIPEISCFMSDFWAFAKKYWIPECETEKKNDAYWSEVASEASTLGQKYNEDRFAVHMILGYLDYLEEKEDGGRDLHWKMLEQIGETRKRRIEVMRFKRLGDVSAVDDGDGG